MHGPINIRKKLTYLLTPWCTVLLEKLFAASQEIPRISLNPKVHYRTHKRPPPVPNLVQPNPVRIPTSHLLEIHPNIIHPSTPRSPHWSLSLPFPPARPYTPPLLTHTRYMHSPSHSFRTLVKNIFKTLRHVVHRTQVQNARLQFLNRGFEISVDSGL
jgi:hypothetical protein